MSVAPDCELCRTDVGPLLWRSDLCRAVLAGEPDFPGSCRVVLQRHAAEMTDLEPGEAAALMVVVFAVERAVRDVLRPDKVNLASLGNVVPHLHWHVIPRFRDDRCFPRPIWAEPLRPPPRRAMPEDLAARLRDAIARALA